jgi:hypothetical protein
MPSVADCLRQHAPAYLAKFGDAVPTGHRKVLGAISRCRTGELGGVLYERDDCGRQHWVGRSCGNHHCPTCQVDKTAQWLEKQTSRLMPVHHFLVTFTVRPTKSKSKITRTIEGEKFVAAFTQHILPKGFQKIRHYGRMSSNSVSHTELLEQRP